jgi:ATP-dependent helicase/nuclease subunit B
MRAIRLSTYADPARLSAEAVHRLAGATEGERWCAIVPRGHLRADLQMRVDEACAARGITRAPMVLALGQVLAAHAGALGGVQSMTPLQIRQLVAESIRAFHAEDASRFPGQVVGGRVSEATLRSICRLFTEVEPLGYTAADLRERLLGEERGEAVTDRAKDVVELYQRYLARLGELRLVGPLGQALAAARASEHAPPPGGATHVMVLGLDCAGGADPAYELAAALARNPDVREVHLYLVAPDEGHAGAWPVHGNVQILDRWRRDLEEADASEQEYGARPAPVAELPPRPEALAELARDPFAYGAPTPADGVSVRAVRLPDLHLETEWVASEVHRAILDRGIPPERIAVVARDMDRRAPELTRLLDTLRVPAVASREEPLSSAPIVRALLTLVRLAAHDWRAEDVVSAADSPYLDVGVSPSILAALGEAGTAPSGAADWLARLDGAEQVLAARGEEEERGVRMDRFRHFAGRVDSVLGRGGIRTPAEWHLTLVRMTEEWQSEKAIYGALAPVSRGARARLVRTDLDAINLLLTRSDEWLRGQEIAGTRERGLEVREWLSELETLASESRIRESTYPRLAVHLLEPSQAALRSFDLVFLVGLVDGSFPRSPRPGDHALSETERALLRLPTAEVRAARDRLFFHLAVASAARELVLSAPAADERGRIVVTSPFLSSLPLRLDGLAIEEIPARSLRATTLADARFPRDPEMLAVAEFAGGWADEEVSEGRVPLAARWLTEPGIPRVVDAWGAEHARERWLARTPEDEGEPAPADVVAYAAWMGALPVAPGRLADERHAFSPSDLDEWKRCGLRFYGSRVLGLRGAHAEDESEVAAFGTLQHRVLERLYRGLREDKLLPPRSQADVEEAIRRMDGIAHASVSEFQRSTSERLWPLDLAFLLDVLTPFVRSDLEGLLAAGKNLEYALPRALPVVFEQRLGGKDKPLEFDVEGVRFRLHGTIDRVEVVSDPRLPGHKGEMVLVDYKSGRGAKSRRVADYVEGRTLQLPLYAAMAEKATGGRKVFAIGERPTAAPNERLLIGDVRLAATGYGVEVVTGMEESSGRNIIRYDAPLSQSKEKALSEAARIIGRIRAGDFAPQPGRQCYGCRMQEVCRSANKGAPQEADQRARMPLSTDEVGYEAAEEQARIWAEQKRTRLGGGR